MHRFPARYALPDRLATARLLLRAPMRGDVPALVRLADNPNIARWLTRLPSPYTRADGIGFVEILCQQDDHRAYAVELAGEGLVGIVSLSFFPGAAPELGYWLGEPYWGRGLMSEAVGALLDAARSTGAMPEIGARALAANVPSRRILEKAGFVHLGTAIDSQGPHLGQSVSTYRLEQHR